MTWYDIRWNGQNYLENLSGADEKILTGLGIHGYATQAEAQAHPQTMNALQAALGGANVLAGVTVGTVDQPGQIAQGAGQAASTATSTLGFLKDLFTRHNAVRLAEGILGVALILVAVAELGKGTAVGNAVKKVPFI